MAIVPLKCHSIRPDQVGIEKGQRLGDTWPGPDRLAGGPAFPAFGAGTVDTQLDQVERCDPAFTPRDSYALFPVDVHAPWFQVAHVSSN